MSRFPWTEHDMAPGYVLTCVSPGQVSWRPPGAAITSGWPPTCITDHGLLSGLADDDHAQYALLAGRVDGQTLLGGPSATPAHLGLGGSSIGLTGTTTIQLETPATSLTDPVLAILDCPTSERATAPTLLTEFNALAASASVSVAVGETIFVVWAARSATGVGNPGSPTITWNSQTLTDWGQGAGGDSKAGLRGKTITAGGGGSGTVVCTWGVTPAAATAIVMKTTTSATLFNADANTGVGTTITTGSSTHIHAGDMAIHYSYREGQPNPIGTRTDTGTDLVVRYGEGACLRAAVTEIWTDPEFANCGITGMQSGRWIAGVTSFHVGASSARTGKLTEWKNGDAVVMASVDHYGRFIGDGSLLTNITTLDVPTHDHSGDAGDGANIPETSITDGAILARLAADEFVTGDWTIGTCDDGSEGSLDAYYNAMIGIPGSYFAFQVTYGGFGFIRNDTAELSLRIAGTLENAELYFPGAGGTVLTSTATQNASNKTLNATNKVTGVASNVIEVRASGTDAQKGPSFKDYTDATKIMKWDLTGLTTGTTRVKKFSCSDGTFVEKVGTDYNSGTLTDSVASTTLLATGHCAGMYRVNVYGKSLKAGTAGYALFRVSYNDGETVTDYLVRVNTDTGGIGALDLETDGAIAEGSVVFYSAGTAAITFKITVVGGNSVEYKAWLRTEYLGT